MIAERIAKTYNYSTEGFQVTTEGMEIRVGQGLFHSEDGSMEYPDFSFDVISDADVAVQYDVYLLKEENESGFPVQVDRTEMGQQRLAFYEGETAIQFTLMTINAPAGAATLGDCDITVNRAVYVDEDSSE